ncbi:hypothetical protein GYMLUDRAFT_253337 [Collybiopsis luxurians FD-317 M1]|uniref:Cytochrome P450 n=1 Tax=Collybiopsis luxurians FD-317 M1 TaxID=944289 RepID=A0A0D0BX21_9AGAR|nr:hypothetical protein GYMLUDRAFT_253337 [Collybiopsis luxurians FD-317 M1]
MLDPCAFDSFEMLNLVILAASLAVIVKLVSLGRQYKNIPGPFLSRYSSIPLAFHSRGGKRALYVDSLHQKYGPLVLIAPNNISCSHPDAINVVYAQGDNALPKSDFYKAFVMDGTPNLFNTQDRMEHAKRRKALAHPLSYRSVKEMEDWVTVNMFKLVANLDKLCSTKSTSHEDSMDNQARANGLGLGAEIPGRASGSKQSGGINIHAWFNCFTFDVISDLAFGQSLGMLDRGTDVLPIATSSSRMVNNLGVAAMIGLRGRAAAFLGLFPELVGFGRTGMMIRWLLTNFWPDPLIRKGLSSSDMLSDIATKCVRRRLSPSDDISQIARDDLLNRLVNEIKKSEGHSDTTQASVYERIVVTEAMLLLSAGSDTTADSAAAIMWYILANKSVYDRLMAELDENVGILSQEFAAADELPKHDQVKSLPYLNATIQEALRMFATNSFGLPRVVSNSSKPVMLLGQRILPGTQLSVPAYTIQRDVNIWGEDANEFKVERWLHDADTSLHVKKGDPKHLLTFGVGPRMCIGKNLANMQLQLLIATILLRYKLELCDPEEDLEAIEGFMNKPVKFNRCGFTLHTSNTPLKPQSIHTWTFNDIIDGLNLAMDRKGFQGSWGSGRIDVREPSSGKVVVDRQLAGSAYSQGLYQVNVADDLDNELTVSPTSSKLGLDWTYVLASSSHSRLLIL